MDFQTILRDFHFVNGLWVLLIPASLMAIDFLTGFLNAWAHREIQSAKMRTGLAKKVVEIAILVIGELFTFGMALPEQIMTGVSLYIVLMELVSIAENAEKLGVPIPWRAKKKLKDITDELEGEGKK